MEDDDFYLDPNAFDDDAQLSIIDEEKLKVLEQIKKYADLTADCVRFQEKDEFDTNFAILSRYISNMADLSMLDGGEIEYTDEDGNPHSRKLSDDEIAEAIREIDIGVVDITHKILADVEQDDEAGVRADVDNLVVKSKKSNDDGSLDF